MYYLEKHRDRRNFLLKLSYVPVVVCVLAFARSAFYRITYNPPECQSFGWFSSSSGEFQCDHKPLDFHAICALLWLGIYACQVVFLSLGWNSWHKAFGKLGFIGAFVNAGGMFWLAIHDYLHPMEKTDRPADFTPFMFLVAFKLTACLIMSWLAVTEHQYENHFLWMFRGFITSFTTPVIRFYPAVLRHLAGQECFQQNRDKFVMGAMFVSEVVCVVLYSLAQKRCRKQFWDVFMKLQLLTFAFSLFNEVRFAETHGVFFWGMAQCAVDKYFSPSE